MPIWIAALIALAAIATTYVFCVRPALRGRCAMAPPAPGAAETSRQLAALQEELRVLRAHDSLGDDRGRPTSPDVASEEPGRG